jgi:hypothetical protein
MMHADCVHENCIKHLYSMVCFPVVSSSRRKIQRYIKKDCVLVVLSQTYTSKHLITIMNNRSQRNLNKIFSDRREKWYKYQNPQTQKENQSS